MLTIEHLTKQFGKKTLFRDLCLTVEGPAVLWAPVLGQDHIAAHPHGAGRTHFWHSTGRWPDGSSVSGRPALPAADSCAERDAGIARQCRTIQRANHKRLSTAWHGCCRIGPACSTAFRRTEAPHGSAAGFVGRQRYAAVRRTFTGMDRTPCRCCGSAAGALRRKACLAGYPRPRSHPPSGLAGG